MWEKGPEKQKKNIPVRNDLIVELYFHKFVHTHRHNSHGLSFHCYSPQSRSMICCLMYSQGKNEKLVWKEMYLMTWKRLKKLKNCTIETNVPCPCLSCSWMGGLYGNQSFAYSHCIWRARPAAIIAAGAGTVHDRMFLKKKMFTSFTMLLIWLNRVLIHLVYVRTLQQKIHSFNTIALLSQSEKKEDNIFWVINHGMLQTVWKHSSSEKKSHVHTSFTMALREACVEILIFI